MAKDAQFSATGPAEVAFETAGSDVDVGARLSGKDFGAQVSGAAIGLSVLASGGDGIVVGAVGGSGLKVLGARVAGIDVRSGGEVGVRAASQYGEGFIAGRDPEFGQSTGIYGVSEQLGVFGHGVQQGTGVYGFARDAGYGVRAETFSGTAFRAQSFGRGTAAEVLGAAVVNGRLTVAEGSEGAPDFAIFGSSGSGTGVRGDCKNVGAIDSPDTSAEVKAIGVEGTGPIGVRGRGQGVGVVGTGVVGVRAYGSRLALLLESGAGDLIQGIAPNLQDTGSHVVFRVDRSGNIHSGGADVAEHIDGTEPLEPGDVVEIDPLSDARFRKTTGAHSAAVAGVISLSPGVTLNAGPSDGPSATRPRPQLALVGRVPTKANTEQGPIRPGDLLVSSSVPGQAMRATTEPRPGTVHGKALTPLASGSGTILVLAMLR